MKRASYEGNRTSKKANTTNEEHQFLSSLRCHVLPAHFGKGRHGIFKKQIEKYGGHISETLNPEVSHVIVEETVDINKVAKLVNKEVLKNSVIVKCTWISSCIKEKRIVDCKDLILNNASKEISPSVSSHSNLFVSDGTKDGINSNNMSHAGSHVTKLGNEPPSASNTDNLGPGGRARTTNDNYNDIHVTDLKSSDAVASLNTPTFAAGDDKDSDHSTTQQLPQLGKLQSMFACGHASGASKLASPNSHITAELQKLLQVYQSKNDTWRITGYQRAIAAIQAHPHPITNYQSARKIRGVGEKLAAKVAEIACSGRLRKVEEICGSEETTTITLFMGVWGAGPHTSANWYMQGFRTLEDLRAKATLTRHQKVGLQLYDDLNSRIPRAEASQIHQFVQQCCGEIRTGLLTEVCGSYRRGRDTCGDVDVLVTHPDGHSHEGVFRKLLANMKNKGFLTDDLVTQEDNGSQQKYLGVCKLPGPDTKHRRLDIIVVPYSEFAPAMLYFTGSAHFNRSMRLLATKLGMSLSEHGLRANVVRKGNEKLTAGCLLETLTEESIFRHLSLPYQQPVDRDH
uniref:DNA polymerase n=1 Tax=Hirondellea gigas TaxID=1518452 RepID=A0A2P2I6T7_9CRUS